VRKKLLLTFFVIPLVLSILSATMIGVTAAQETHDIAVVSVTPSQTFVKTGELVNITVVVENQGTENETFDVTAYYDTTTVETKTVPNLETGTNTTLTFTWNTTDVKEEVYATENKEKTYTINATASTVFNETDTQDNTLVSPSTVRVISQYITVLPQSTVDTTLDIGKTYTVSIYTDYNGTDVWGYEFTLTYNPFVLQGINVTNGDLITKAKDETATFQAGTFDNVNGKLSLTFTSFQYPDMPQPLTSGPGTLANVTFTVVGMGDSDIELGTETIAPSRLIRVTEDGYGVQEDIISDIEPDLHHIVHGYFRNTIEKPVHDIAVVSVTSNATSVEAGEPVNVTVVIKNNGTITEKGIKVKVYYDFTVSDWLIGTQTISTLEAGANTTLTFTWDTTDVGKGDHSLIAVALQVHGEENIKNNKLVSPTVTVELPPEQPLPIELIIGVMVVIVVVIAVVAYAVKRRKKPTLE